MSAQSLALWHVRELQALLDRLEPDHHARPRVQARLDEAKLALQTVKS